MSRLILLLLLAFTLPVSAQSMVVISGNSDARACFQAAGWAAQMQRAGHSDIDQCTRALHLESLSYSDRVATLVNRGILWSALEDYEQALADYRRAQQMSPESAEVELNLGNLWYISGHYREAVNQYSRALDLAIRSPHIAYFNRAMAQEKAGNVPAAIADYKATLNLTPQWSKPQKRLQRLTGLKGTSF